MPSLPGQHPAGSTTPVWWPRAGAGSAIFTASKLALPGFSVLPFLPGQCGAPTALDPPTGTPESWIYSITKYTSLTWARVNAVFSLYQPQSSFNLISPRYFSLFIQPSIILRKHQQNYVPSLNIKAVSPFMRYGRVQCPLGLHNVISLTVSS